jgi:hypothetical protein
MISVVLFLNHFRRPFMVLKSAFVAALCTGLLASVGAAAADEYRPSEFLGLDLSKALLSPKRLGPEAHFAPVPVEASTDAAQAGADTSVWPRLSDKTHVVKTQAVKAHVGKTHVANTHVAKPHLEETRAAPQRAAAHTNARVKLARRHGNPLDAQARDTRIQTWPCRSGGICNWQR